MIVVEPSPVDGDQEALQTAAWLRRHGRPARVGSEFESCEEVWPDVWTSPLDPRLQNQKLSCLADFLLKTHDVLGITGTAGKTTTAWLLSQLLPDTGSHRARAQNLWPGPSLLDADSTIVAELTSSHLAFCHHSPRIAAITNFWPDHLEIHGSLEAYREAKSNLFRYQKPQDVSVLPWHDPEAQDLAAPSPAQRAWFSTEQEPPPALIRVFPHQSGILVEGPSGRRQLDTRPDPALLCALAMAEASGLPWEIPDHFEYPPHRAARHGRLIDDTLAATPRKAGYHLKPGTHLVAGGLLEIAGQPVHASPPEQAALEHWLEAIRKNCTRIDLFGPAGQWLHKQLAGSHLHHSLETAVQAALQTSTGPVLVSPGFPMPQEDRLKLVCLSTKPSKRL
ncbi:MAG: hypothetical protein KF760_35480, partial [Candidatus Eremiobacteraeota bacterium]|nr:hypothetical protein [Candidatus Eremiobacteraeota bacterium]MCW5872835.1 hypothetical protein [Candidatus Eremiobacteraeota bacterium]